MQSASRTLSAISENKSSPRKIDPKIKKKLSVLPPIDENNAVTIELDCDREKVDFK